MPIFPDYFQTREYSPVATEVFIQHTSVLSAERILTISPPKKGVPSRGMVLAPKEEAAPKFADCALIL